MKPLVILTGPTAVGKTNLSIGLAKRINGDFNRTDSSWKNRTVDPISKDLRCRDHFRRFYAGL